MAGGGSQRAGRRVVAEARGGEVEARGARPAPASAERPRERLLGNGPGALTDAELLAVVLGAGVAGEALLGISRRLLGAFGGLAALARAGAGSLQDQPGMGPARTAALGAALELARRACAEALARGPAFASPAEVKDYLRLTLAGREREVFVGLFLDAQHRLIAAEELFAGTLTQTSVYPREVVRRALAHNAAAALFAHNHPSGVAEPSRADELLTAQLRGALGLVDVRLLDHLIVAGPAVLSMAERGLV